uniref:Uncharacterized protein n=1 Tax=Panagrolaimus sp. PS1159 TaxID=55785 RepID=A0AC35GA24_9BILA
MPIVRQISFNHQQDCFALATDEGVRIFNTDPLVELIHLKSQDVGSVRFVSLMDIVYSNCRLLLFGLNI